jgi:hypothetical protein
MIYYYLPILLIVTAACGTGEKGGADQTTNDAVSSNQPASEPEATMQSISLNSLAELACSKANLHQLAYILDEESFYVCEGAWAKVEIKGPKGDKGSDGAMGQSTNSANLWKDSITGLSWILGGASNWAGALGACTSPYRLPNGLEGLNAGLHGIRAIAGQLSLQADFWDDQIGEYIGLNGSAQVAVLPTASGNTKSIFCVRD